MEKTRTLKQNNALHKYFQELADALNEAGVDQAMFIDKLDGLEVPITKEFIHQIWKLTQEQMGMENSTTKLTTSQVSQVYDTINRFTANEWGLSTPFPSLEELSEKADEV